MTVFLPPRQPARIGNVIEALLGLMVASAAALAALVVLRAGASTDAEAAEERTQPTEQDSEDVAGDDA